MENKEFNLRNFLYNNPLLEEGDTKKGNKKEQKHYEGAIRDNRDHKKALDKDIASDEKKLAKLKKDAKGENVKKGNKKEQKHYEGAIRDNRDHKKALDKDIGADEKKLSKLKKDYKKDINESKETALRKAIQNEITSILREAEDEEVDVDTEEDVDVEDTEDVDVDIDTEVDVDDESAESEIEVDSELAGEDSDTAAVLGLLTKAQEEAEALGDEKLMDQIGNTITYYTRAHVVKSGESRADLGENKRFTRIKK